MPLLLFLVMILAVTAPSVIQFKILLVKIDAKERLEKDQLQVVRIAEKDAQCKKVHREILIGDRLFDVKEFGHHDGVLVVRGIYDDEETALGKQLDEAWGNQNSNQGLVILKYFLFLSNGYLNESLINIEGLSKDVKVYAGRMHFYHKRVFIKIPYPPPQQKVIT